MKLLHSMAVAFSMYSRLPVPAVPWTAENMAWSLCCFPAVGLVIAVLFLAWCALCQWLELGQMVFAAGALLLPILITGGIHLDGFCDTCDALGSHQERRRKLEIMKDPHAGAFAVIGCVCYLIAVFALWCRVEPEGGDRWALALIPVLSRLLSAYGAVTLPNARGSGLLAAFTEAAHLRQCRRILLVMCFFCFWVVGVAGHGMAAVVTAVLLFFWYRHMALREFGGITGDLSGWFLQICEGGCLLAVVLAQRLEGVL